MLVYLDKHSHNTCFVLTAHTHPHAHTAKNSSQTHAYKQWRFLSNSFNITLEQQLKLLSPNLYQHNTRDRAQTWNNPLAPARHLVRFVSPSEMGVCLPGRGFDFSLCNLPVFFFFLIPSRSVLLKGIVEEGAYFFIYRKMWMRLMHDMFFFT